MAIPKLMEIVISELECAPLEADILKAREEAANLATCFNVAFRVKMLAGKSS